MLSLSLKCNKIHARSLTLCIQLSYCFDSQVDSGGDGARFNKHSAKIGNRKLLW